MGLNKALIASLFLLVDNMVCIGAGIRGNISGLQLLLSTLESCV